MRLNIRQQLEDTEKRLLSSHAFLSAESKGRLHAEPDTCELRTVFQRDRDRIIHSKTFRRLKHKTQVFLSPAGDHYRTRLTHVLEVSQIARTMAVCLRLNEYLTEAIALAHDLGHTPFGHAGEVTLNELHPGGFKHDVQSLRVVDVLENDRRGLNLTWEVRNGIIKHSKGYGDILPVDKSQLSDTLEGQIVRVADIMAYVNHDMDDALRAGMIRETDLPADLRRVVGDNTSSRIDAMVKDLVAETLRRDDGCLHLSDLMEETISRLRMFLYDNVYRNYRVHNEFVKAQKIIRELYHFFLEHDFPHGSMSFCEFCDYCETREFELRGESGKNKHREVCDFIAGMTDRYALDLYNHIFMPKPWSVF
jgi:dGTPase